MNLCEFLDYRRSCPICLATTLTTAFQSKKRQVIREENGRFLVLLNMDAIKKHHNSYKVGYSIDRANNQFCIEFYTKDDEWIEKESPIHLINRFKIFDKNQREYKIYKYCGNCNRYNYTSNKLTIDYKTCSIGELEINTEFFGLTQPINEGYKIYKLINRYFVNESVLFYTKADDEFLAQEHIHMVTHPMDIISLPIIKFTSKDEIINRISKLLVFS